jgi:ABC-type multidrug transport system ATPase subunit/ABC-type multidrug transport system permease subunit
MNLTVPMGGIYALIGPSGCGKTSILRCMMGFLTPDGGTIKVFGKVPGDPKSNVPGKDLGYMPQDVALNEQLTVYEMLRYFGRIFLLSGKELEKRINHLVDILDIPDRNRFINTLSGGQRRRVSFACAVIHKPKLAILDEPTVGVDPLIREKIWDYLLSMTAEGCTILLTTHYIEETRRASVIGFLRKGYLLAEEPPDKIITELKVDKLEDAFYQLCVHEIERRKKYNAYTDEEEEKQFFNYPTIISAIMWATAGLQQFRRHKRLDRDWLYMLYAIVEKFFIQIWREKLILFVWLFIPVIALVTTCACIGNLPEIDLGVINDDNDVVSDAILSNLDPKIWNIKNYTDPIQARMDVDFKRGIWGFVHFYGNFSDTILQFAEIYKNIDNVTVNFNVINFHADYTNKILLVVAALSGYQAFPVILQDALRDAGYNPRLLDFPLAYGEPVYGKPLFQEGIDLFDVKNLIIPGCLLYGAFATSMIVALYFMRLEKLNNMFERTYSAGVSATQIIVAQFIVRTFFNFFSVAFTLWVALQYYNVSNEGSLGLVMLLMLLQNLSGLAYGLAFTAISVDPIHFIAFAGGSVGSFLFFSGEFSISSSHVE